MKQEILMRLFSILKVLRYVQNPTHNNSSITTLSSSCIMLDLSFSRFTAGAATATAECSPGPCATQETMIFAL